MGYSRSSARNTGAGGRSTGGGRRGDAVGGAGLHQQRAADTRREPDRPVERHLERRARAYLVAPARARDLDVVLLRRPPSRRSRASPALRPSALDAAYAVSSLAAHRASRVRPRAAADLCRHCGPAAPVLLRRRSPASTRPPPRRARPPRRRAQCDRRSTKCPTAQCVPGRRPATVGHWRARRGNPGAGAKPTPAGAATRPTRRTRGSRTTPRLIRQRRSRAHSRSRRWCPVCPRIPVPSPRTARRARPANASPFASKCQAAQRSRPLVKLISSIPVLVRRLFLLTRTYGARRTGRNRRAHTSNAK